jgi:hypothetical protein
MKKLTPLFIILIITQSFIVAQGKQQKNGYLYLGIGQGYVDGINWVSAFPTISLGYEKEMNKYFSINFHLNSYYCTFGDSYFTDDANGHPIMDILVENAWGPFITDKEKEKIKNVGIKDLSSENFTIKQYSLPAILNLNFNAIRYKNHNLGLGLGGGFSYSIYNWWKDYFPIKKITLNDGSIYENVQLSQGTEFRNIDPFLEYISIFYEYKSKKFNLGLKFGAYGLYLGNYGAYHYDSSIYFKLKL